MGAAATPALAYEKHVRSMLCRILVLYWPSNTVAAISPNKLYSFAMQRLVGTFADVYVSEAISDFREHWKYFRFSRPKRWHSWAFWH